MITFQRQSVGGAERAQPPQPVSPENTKLHFCVRHQLASQLRGDVVSLGERSVTASHSVKRQIFKLEHKGHSSPFRQPACSSCAVPCSAVPCFCLAFQWRRLRMFCRRSVLEFVVQSAELWDRRTVTLKTRLLLFLFVYFTCLLSGHHVHHSEGLVHTDSLIFKLFSLRWVLS